MRMQNCIFVSLFSRKVLLIGSLLFLLSACDEKSLDYDFCLATQLPDEEVIVEAPDVGNGTNPIATPEQLSGAITFEDAIRRSGSLTSVIPATNLGGGITTSSEITIADNSAALLPVTPALSSSSSRIAAVFFQIEGADEYFIIPIPSSSVDFQGNTEISLTGPIPLDPTNGALIQVDTADIPDQTFATGLLYAFLVDSGSAQPDFNAEVWANQSDPASWTTLTTVGINTAIVEVGSLSVTLSWDTDGTDVDLWLIEPDGHRIYYADTQSSQGDGFLDRDDTDGFGPENILFQSNIPEGLYTIQVNYFAGAPLTNYTVSVAACGGQITLGGNLTQSGGQGGEVDTVYRLNYAPGCVLAEVTSAPDIRERTVSEQAQCQAFEGAIESAGLNEEE